MPTSFLSDDDFWRVVCAARLAELDLGHGDPKQHADAAGRLQADPHFRRLSAIEAAEAFHAAVVQQAA